MTIKFPALQDARAARERLKVAVDHLWWEATPAARLAVEAAYANWRAAEAALALVLADHATVQHPPPPTPAPPEAPSRSVYGRCVDAGSVAPAGSVAVEAPRSGGYRHYMSADPAALLGGYPGSILRLAPDKEREARELKARIKEQRAVEQAVLPPTGAHSVKPGTVVRHRLTGQRITLTGRVVLQGGKLLKLGVLEGEVDAVGKPHLRLWPDHHLEALDAPAQGKGGQRRRRKR